MSTVYQYIQLTNAHILRVMLLPFTGIAIFLFADTHYTGFLIIEIQQVNISTITLQILSVCPSLTFTASNNQEVQLSQRDHATHCFIWNLVKCRANGQWIVFERPCNWWMTIKVIQGYWRWCHLMGNTHCVSKKRAPFYFYNNFVRCWPIFIILSLPDSSGNLQ